MSKSRSYEERKKIQKMWEAGETVTEIARKLNAPTRSIYAEMERGRNGARLPDQRLQYDADLAQRRWQEAIERRGTRNQYNTKAGQKEGLVMVYYIAKYLHMCRTMGWTPSISGLKAFSRQIKSGLRNENGQMCWP